MEVQHLKSGISILCRTILGNDALESITLFIAESKPKEMETVKHLIISILNRKNKLNDDNVDKMDKI